MILNSCISTFKGQFLFFFFFQIEFSAFVYHLYKNPHHEQTLVYVQVRVVAPPVMLNWLSGYSALVLASLVAPRHSWSPETAVKGHADGVEAPG